LPTAEPSANLSHRQTPIFADGQTQAIGKLGQARRRRTPADAVIFADGQAVRLSAKYMAMPTADHRQTIYADGL
jgi:hypothetical protein